MWTLFAALVGGRSPHSASIRRSVETDSPLWSSSSTSSARFLPPDRCSLSPCSSTSSGPSIRKSTLGTPFLPPARTPTRSVVQSGFPNFKRNSMHLQGRLNERRARSHA